VGDTKSMIVHPATSIHHGLTLADQERAGVFEDTLRLSVGTEDAGDLLRDLDRALEGAPQSAPHAAPPAALHAAP
jgi:O-acetylhomoserine (thiol)-lyase